MTIRSLFSHVTIVFFHSSAKDETGSNANGAVPPQTGANNNRHTPHYSPPPLQTVPPAPPVVMPVATTAPTIVTSVLSSQSSSSSSPQSVTPNIQQQQQQQQQQAQKAVPTTPVVVPSLSSLDIAHHSPGGMSIAGTGGSGVVTSSSNSIRKLPFINSTTPDTSMSLFSSSGFPTHRSQKPRVQAAPGGSLALHLHSQSFSRRSGMELTLMFTFRLQSLIPFQYCLH